MTDRIETTKQKRRQILSYIRSFITAYQAAPTLDEIVEAVNIPKTTLNYHMGRMEATGLIKRVYINDRAVGRAMEITDKGRAYLNGNPTH